VKLVVNVLTEAIEAGKRSGALKRQNFEKVKARRPYEFGVKVSLAITAKEGFVVGARSMPGNPYDGHTLGEQLEQVEILTGQRPKQAFVDRGYRGAQVPEGCTMYLSGQKRGVTAALKRWIKRRSAIEPHIGHMKSEGLLGRCHLKGAEGDAMHAVLCGAGHNLGLLLNRLPAFFAPALGQHPCLVLRTDALDIRQLGCALTYVELGSTVVV
jgi:IS5 family transposase